MTKMDGVLYPQIYDPFKAFLHHYDNTYLEHRLHKGFGGKAKLGNCAPGKSFIDHWYDYGGKGYSKPTNEMIKNHPACIESPKGSFFDQLPCPCNRLTYGLSAKKFSS